HHMFSWTYSLVALELGLERGWIRSWEHLLQRRKMLRELRRWCKHAPGRAYRLTWIAGTRARRRGSLETVLALYDQAIDGARKSGFRHDAALIAEQAARYCQGRGRMRLARPYLREAWAGYRQWGAQAK